MSKPKVAFIGTGGTIASHGTGALDLIAYSRTKRVYPLDELLGMVPVLREVAEIVEAPFRQVHSTSMGPADWPDLARHIDRILSDDSELDGAVVTHGTATLEETAYFLNLVLKTKKTVVVVGAQRPPTGLSTDAFLNLVNGARTAASPHARGLGVLVCLNDEIHAAREVTKTSTFRLQTFRTPDFGLLGHADADEVTIYRRPIRAHAPNTPFSPDPLLPRVDIAISYAGSDGAQIRGLFASKPAGIVVAGFAPGMTTPGEREAMKEAIESGIAVVQATRALSGRVIHFEGLRPKGVIASDNLSPQKARVLLMLALAHGINAEKDLIDIFKTF
ncbi:MAG: asparaginase [Rhodospirillales bacterium]